MYRYAICLIFITTATAFAQKDPEPKDGKVTIAMTLTPTAAPKPLGKMRIYPDYEDSQPGNRVQGLLKTFMEQDKFFQRVNTDDWYKLLEMPLSELPKDIREKEGINNGIAYDSKYTKFLGFTDKGARFNRIEWNEWFDIRHDGFNLLLPEVQKIRAIGNVIKLRLRGEIKNGEFDKAAESIKTLFGIAQALEQHPTLIGQLVGIAIAANAMQTIEEMIQQPGCPNLYWAFTDLPQPLISLRQGMSGEKIFLTSQFKDYLVTNRALTEKEIGSFLKDINAIFNMESGKDAIDSSKIMFALIASDKKRMDATRERLKAEGVTEDVLKTMPVMQLAILDEFYKYTVLRDEMYKGFHLPYHEAIDIMKKSEEKIKAAKASGMELLGPMLLPAFIKVKQSQARLDQRVAYVRLIEAIRLYAHGNKGALPTKLDDLNVPVPKDPISGKSFEYTVKDGKATITGTNPQPGNAHTNRVFELQFQK